MADYGREYFSMYAHLERKNLDDIPLFRRVKRMVEAERVSRGCKPLKILDVGCGVGYLTNYLGKNNKAYGLDGSSQAVGRAKSLYPGFEFRQADLFSMPFSEGEFDVVVMVNVIEHLFEPSKALEEVRRVLAEDGLLILSTPEVRSLYSMLFINDETHVHEFRRKHLLKLLGLYYDVQEVVYTNSVAKFPRLINELFAIFLPADVLVKCRKR